jgi:hypoxanthine phosphoribosyltransferase
VRGKLGVILLFTSFRLLSLAHCEDHFLTPHEILSMDNLELLISQDEIKNKIADAARVLDAQYEGEELTIVMVMKGALCITADLIRALKTPCIIESVTASSYGKRGTKRGELQISGLEEIDLSSKNVLLVDDIFDSGQTLSQIFAKLKQKNPKSLKSLVLLAKKVKRDTTYLPDYALFDIENLFVIGYGLDYKEHYRGLPGIYFFTGEP